VEPAYRYRGAYAVVAGEKDGGRDMNMSVGNGEALLISSKFHRD
jgi:hypothetical protein